MAQTAKKMPAVQGTQVRSLRQKDPLEKGMATHPRILAWRIPRTEEPGGLQSMGWQSVEHDRVTLSHTHTHTHTPLEGGIHSAVLFWPLRLTSALHLEELFKVLSEE